MAHRTFEELEDEINTSDAKSYIGRKCFHYKDPEKHYEILDVVIIEESEEVALMYASSRYPELKWIRPFKEFFDDKEIEGKTVKRFSFID